MWGFFPCSSMRFFPSPKPPDELRITPSLLLDGYQEFFPEGVKLRGHETDHSPPSHAEIKNEWIHISAPLRQYLFMSCTSITWPVPVLSWVHTACCTGALETLLIGWCPDYEAMSRCKLQWVLPSRSCTHA